MTRFPLDVKLVSGQLSVRIFSHSIEPLDWMFWSFVSNGLRSFGQREFVITLKRRTGEAEDAFPRWVFGLLRDVQQNARAGHLLGPGSYSELHFKDPESIKGLVYAPVQELRGVAIPPDAMAAIFVGAEDLATVQRVGAFRVLARLGRRARWFPFPPWGDQDGPSSAPPGADAGSMLGRMTRLGFPPVTFLLRNHRPEMAVPRSQAEKLHHLLAQVPPDTAFAIVGSPSPEANALLVWSPGQDGRDAISPHGSDGSRLGGFHLIVAVMPGEEQVSILEDGFGAVWTPSSWGSFMSALSRKSAFEMPGTGRGPGFELVWLPG